MSIIINSIFARFTAILPQGFLSRPLAATKPKSKSEKCKTLESRQVGITLYYYDNYIRCIKKTSIKNKELKDSSTEKNDHDGREENKETLDADLHRFF